MPPRKVVEVDPDSLAASRTWRANAGVPSRAFDDVTERLEKCVKKAEKDAKAAAAEEIQADPHTGDDTLARKPLREFITPTLTGNDELDQTNYDQARLDYLIHYLAVRDGLDVRAAIDSGTIGLAELEEIYLDRDAAAGLLSEEDEPSDELNEGTKGKQKAANSNDKPDKTMAKPPQVRTTYTGITVDQANHTVTAKYAPKDANSGRSGGKRPLEQGQNGHRKSPRGVETSNPPRPVTHRDATPLRRTDSTTYVDGRRIAMPVYYSRDKLVHGPSGTTRLLATPRPNLPVIPPAGGARISSYNGPSDGTHTPGVWGWGNAPAPGPKAAVNPSQPVRTHNMATHNRAPPTQAHRAAEPHPHPIPNSRPPKPLNPSRHAHSSDRSPRDQPPYDKRPSNHQIRQPNAAATVIAASSRCDVPRESAANLGPRPNQPRGQPSQPVQQSQRVKRTPKENLNRVQNSAPRDNPRNRSPVAAAVAESDIDQEEWSEEEVEPAPAANSTAKTTRCSGKVNIKSFPEEEQPIVREMARSARARIIANGTYDDAEATLYTPYAEWPETWNERETREAIVSQALMKACEVFDQELRFQPRHVKCDIFAKTGPFENKFIPEACKAVAFDKPSAVGAKFPDVLVGMPATYIAYVCALVHHVIFSYRSGEYKSQNLSVPIQRSAFRRALHYQITMEEKKRITAGNIRRKLFDYCIAGLRPKPEVHHSSPEPEREWSSDEDEVYVSRFAGDGQPMDIDDEGNGDDDEGEEVGAGGEDDGDADLRNINWEEELMQREDVTFDAPEAGPSGTRHDEDVEMEDPEQVDQLAEDGDCREDE